MRNSDLDIVRQILDIKHMQAAQDLAALKQKIKVSLDAAQVLKAQKEVSWEAIGSNDAKGYSLNMKFIAFINSKQRAELERRANLQVELRIAEAHMKSLLQANAAINAKE
jgi:hypothetical protein